MCDCICDFLCATLQGLLVRALLLELLGMYTRSVLGNCLRINCVINFDQNTAGQNIDIPFLVIDVIWLDTPKNKSRRISAYYEGWDYEKCRWRVWGLLRVVLTISFPCSCPLTPKKHPPPITSLIGDLTPTTSISLPTSSSASRSPLG